MVTPNREEIYRKAVELYSQDCYRNGARDLADKTPEYSELVESGFVAAAQSLLMQSNPRCVVIEKEEPKIDLAKNGLEVDLDELLKSGVYVTGTSGSGKSHVMMYVADKLMEKGVLVYVIDPSQDWMENSNIRLVYPITDISENTDIYNESTVYDTSRLYVSDQKRFIEAFCEALYQQAVNTEPRKWRFVIFEEAQLVYPEGSFRSDKKSASLQLVSVGRNFKLRFGAITPFSSNVDKYLVKTTQQRFFGWTCELNDLNYLRGFLGQQAEELSTLKTGEFLYHAPSKNKLEKISIEPHKRTVKTKKVSPHFELGKMEGKNDIGREERNQVLGSIMVMAFVALVFFVFAL